MLVSLIDTLDIRAILLSNHYGPKLSSNFNYRKKILTTQKLYNYTFLVPLSHPAAYFATPQATAAGELSQCYHCILVPCSI